MDYGNTPNLGQKKPQTGAENWQNASPDRDPRAVGNKVITDPEALRDDNFVAEQIDLQMPPGHKEDGTQTPSDVSEEPSPETTPTADYDKSVIKTGEKLDPRVIPIIEAKKHKLDQDGNMESFYDEYQNIRSINLENSFNRKLAA